VPNSNRCGVLAPPIAATYTSFCRMTGTPEELTLDPGLNKQMGDRAGRR
jgi:hypothetical protein